MGGFLVWWRQTIEGVRFLDVLLQTLGSGETAMKPERIEQTSFAIIKKELQEKGIVLPREEEPVILRCIHTSADFSYAKTLHFSEDAVQKGASLLLQGATIVTDTNMALAGIRQKQASAFGCSLFCYMADEAVAAEATERQITRAYVSMERAAGLPHPVIIAVGNAPTALMALHDLAEKQGFWPDFLIGVPVGFVNVESAKETVLRDGFTGIVNRGRKGGSNIAAAIVNALLGVAKQMEEQH